MTRSRPFIPRLRATLTHLSTLSSFAGRRFTLARLLRPFFVAEETEVMISKEGQMVVTGSHNSRPTTTSYHKPWVRFFKFNPFFSNIPGHI